MNEKVIAVPVPSDVLHFKCLLSAWDSKTLVISDEPAGREVWQAITKALGEEEVRRLKTKMSSLFFIV